jgi:hypothetical protein
MWGTRSSEEQELKTLKKSNTGFGARNRKRASMEETMFTRI